MQEEYWHERWERDEIGFNQSTPNELLQRYFGELRLKPGSRVFVPLCGKSIDMLWLAGQGYEVLGVELSSIACGAFFHENDMIAKVTKKENIIVYQSEKIRLLSGDFFQLSKEMLGQVDIVYDRAALIALPEEIRQRYVKELIKLLDPSTPIFLITTSYNENEMKGPPFSVSEEDVKALYSNHFDIKQLYNKVIKAIPSHLQAKGLGQANEHVYYLTPK